MESTHQGVCVCVCHKQDGRCNERGVVSETKGGLGKHKLKALNVTAHSIALRHRSLLPILFAAFYNINNLENIPADCFCLSEKCVKRDSRLTAEDLPACFEACGTGGHTEFGFCRLF